MISPAWPTLCYFFIFLLSVSPVWARHQVIGPMPSFDSFSSLVSHPPISGLDSILTLLLSGRVHTFFLRQQMCFPKKFLNGRVSESDEEPSGGDRRPIRCGFRRDPWGLCLQTPVLRAHLQHPQFNSLSILLPTCAGLSTIFRSLLKARVFPPLNLKARSKVVLKRRFYHTVAEGLVSLISTCIIRPILWTRRV